MFELLKTGRLARRSFLFYQMFRDPSSALLTTMTVRMESSVTLSIRVIEIEQQYRDEQKMFREAATGLFLPGVYELPVQTVQDQDWKALPLPFLVSCSESFHQP